MACKIWPKLSEPLTAFRGADFYRGELRRAVKRGEARCSRVCHACPGAYPCSGRIPYPACRCRETALRINFRGLPHYLSCTHDSDLPWSSTILTMPPQLQLLGVVRVPLSHLHFVDGAGTRLYSQQRTERLERLFRGTQIDHTNLWHWVDGYVDNCDVATIWSDLGLTPRQLKQANIEDIYPLLANHVIGYTQGRHAIEAARNICQSSCWTVRLFRTDMNRLHSNQAIRRLTERYRHESSDSDGHIYAKLRQFRANGRDFHEWHERLSPKKKRAFRAIGKHLAIATALDKLIDLPAVIDSLQLTCFLRHFDFRLDDELLAGLEHIYQCWSRLSGSNGDDRRHLDKNTIAKLEGRAPASSPSDSQWTRLVFETGQAFARMTDSQGRLAAERRVQATSIMIPGLKSLQSHMLYLQIAAEIIWAHILPTNLRQEAKRHQFSLRSALRSCWKESAPYVEVQEGEFAPVLGPGSFSLAYNQLVLAALRQFPFLTNSEPRADEAGKAALHVDPHCVSLFHRRAKLLGFWTVNIEQGAAVTTPPFRDKSHPGVNATDAYDVAEILSKIELRWGRPCWRIFRIVQAKAFLPTIAGAAGENGVDVLFLLRDFLQTFFEPCFFEYDRSRQSVSIDTGFGTQQDDVPLPVEDRTQPFACTSTLRTAAYSFHDAGSASHQPDDGTGAEWRPGEVLSSAELRDHGTGISDRGAASPGIEASEPSNSNQRSQTACVGYTGSLSRDSVHVPRLCRQGSIDIGSDIGCDIGSTSACQGGAPGWNVERGADITTGSWSPVQARPPQQALVPPPGDSNGEHAIDQPPSFSSSLYSQSTVSTPFVLSPSSARFEYSQRDQRHRIEKTKARKAQLWAEKLRSSSFSDYARSLSPVSSSRHTFTGQGFTCQNTSLHGCGSLVHYSPVPWSPTASPPTRSAITDGTSMPRYSDLGGTLKISDGSPPSGDCSTCSPIATRTPPPSAQLNTEDHPTSARSPAVTRPGPFHGVRNLLQYLSRNGTSRNQHRQYRPPSTWQGFDDSDMESIPIDD